MAGIKSKITKHRTKQKMQLIWVNWNWLRMTQMIELVDEDIEADSVDAFQVFQKPEERLRVWSRDTEDI